METALLSLLSGSIRNKSINLITVEILFPVQRLHLRTPTETEASSSDLWVFILKLNVIMRCTKTSAGFLDDILYLCVCLQYEWE